MAEADHIDQQLLTVYAMYPHLPSTITCAHINAQLDLRPHLMCATRLQLPNTDIWSRLGFLVW